VEDVLRRYSHLIRRGASVKNISMLCVKLAKEAILGEEVIRRCTPGGTHDLPGLPYKELYDLKTIILKQYPSTGNAFMNLKVCGKDAGTL